MPGTLLSSLVLPGATAPYALLAGLAERTNAERLLDQRSILEWPGIDRTGGSSVTAAWKVACDAAVAGNFELWVPEGIYRFDTQLVVKGGLKLRMSKRAILLRNFAGGTGNRYANALIRNERCRLNSDYVGTGAVPVHEPVYPPPTTDDGIHISGGRIRPVDSTMIGGGVYFTACRDLIIDGLVIERTHLDYAITIGGEGVIVRNCHILGNREVFEDGIHIIEGDGFWIHDNEINSGDDGIALGIGYNVPIRNVVALNNKVASHEGHAFTLYAYRAGVTETFPPPTRRIENVFVDGLAGTAGWVRNGLMVSELDVARYTVTNVVSSTLTETVFDIGNEASSEDAFYVGCRLTHAGGTGTAAQVRYCTAYDGPNRRVTVAPPWTAIDTTTQLDVHGALCRDVTIANVDLRGGPMAGHDGTNPRGIELQNILRLRLDSIHINDSIREALKLTSIIGPSRITNFHGGPPQIGGTTHSCVSLVDCPNLVWDGGSAQAHANHPIYVQGGWFDLRNIQTPELATSAAAVNCLSLVTNPTDVKLSGMRPAKKAGATGTRLARIGAANVKIELDSCDCSKIDDVIFENQGPPATPALKRSWRGILTPAPGNIVARPASGNVQLYDRYSDTIITNGGAVNTVTLALWPGRVGDKHRFRRVANFAFRIDPDVDEIIIGPTSTGGQGKYLELGSNCYVELECVEDGVWQVMAVMPSNATLSFEL